jgi:putative transposase
MEVKRTVPVKLSVPDDRVDDLHQTIEQFNHACNYTVQNGRNDDGYLILNKSKIHDEVYHDFSRGLMTLRGVRRTCVGQQSKSL